MSKHEGIPYNDGWHFFLDGPRKHQWLPKTNIGDPVSEMDCLNEEDGTYVHYIRSPLSDAPGIYAYKLEEIDEVESI